MEEKFGYFCDKNEYYIVNSKTNIAQYIKQPNAFTLRIEAKLNILDAKRLSTAQTIANVFNRNFEPDVEKQIPPEMTKRPRGHDFGMIDYVN